MAINRRSRAIGVALATIVMGFPYYNPITANAAPHNAPTPGNFIGWPECVVGADEGGGATVTISGEFAQSERTARLIPSAMPVYGARPPAAVLRLNGVIQQSLVIPPATTRTRVELTFRRVSTLQGSYLQTQWTDAANTSFLFATINPLGYTVNCIVSSN